MQRGPRVFRGFMQRIIKFLKSLFANPTIQIVDVGRVTVTFYYETPSFRGSDQRTFEGEWLDTGGVFGFIQTDAVDQAKDFINGELPVKVTKHGYIPRFYIYHYELGARQEHRITEPNATLRTRR